MSISQHSRIARLPMGSAPFPLFPAHFPAVWQAVIWRNWPFFSAERLADLLDCDARTIQGEARRLGLKVEGHRVSDSWKSRGYQTIIRDNWHLLPYSQLLQLLDWQPEKMSYVLKEEDFLWVKQGMCKPDCPPVRYAPLTAEQLAKTDRLRQDLRRLLPNENALEYIEEPFSFAHTYPVIARTQGHAWDFKLSFIHSISQIGPSQGSLEAWSEAKKRGLRTMAKVQLNNSWELSAIPYIPVPYLVFEHLDNLRKAAVDGLMLNWTLGGYPGGNLELLNYSSVEKLAEAKFSHGIAPVICQAWKMFSEAFRQFPCELVLLYRAPMNIGPANLLYRTPTGYSATMITYPYDDLENWSAIYPAEVMAQQFRKLTDDWRKGLEFMNGVQVTDEDRDNFSEVKTMAEAAYCHLRSTYLQIEFIRQRESGDRDRLGELVREERQLAVQLLDLARKDSRIGFEASNHYYYTLQGLAEKIVQCNDFLASM